MTDSDPLDTRSSVLRRVKDPDDRDSWQAFFDLYRRPIRSLAIRAGLTEDEAEEVVQNTLIEVSRRIQSFEYDRSKGSFKAWIFTLTRWRVANQFHKRVPGSVPIECLDSDEGDDSGKHRNSVIRALSDEPDETWEREWRQELFDAALSKVRETLPPKQFQVFELLTAKQLSVARVAELFRTNRAHVHLLKFRVVFALKKEVARLEKEHF